MKNFYASEDGVSVSFSDILTEPDTPRYVKILLDRCDKNNFDYILTQIPGFEVLESRGFTDDEIEKWIDYTKCNSFLIWEYALERQAEELADDI